MHGQNTTSLDKRQDKKVKIFPNPATTTLNILGLENSTRASITILDIYGKTVLQHHWKIENESLGIPVATLRSGVYSISIISLEQRVHRKFYKK